MEKKSGGKKTKAPGLGGEEEKSRHERKTGDQKIEKRAEVGAKRDR